RLMDVQALRQIADAEFPLRQLTEQEQPVFVGEHLERRDGVPRTFAQQAGLHGSGGHALPQLVDNTLRVYILSHCIAFTKAAQPCTRPSKDSSTPQLGP